VVRRRCADEFRRLAARAVIRRRFAPHRLRRALVETDLTVETIGARLGYRDPSYFIKSFKRTHTHTPLQWRRAHRAQP
jgi:AraC-like DNA-binding protein